MKNEPSESSTTSRALKMLDFVANEFEDEPWTFTHDLGDLKHIRYRSDYTGYNAWYRRVWRAFGPSMWGPLSNVDKMFYSSWRDKVNLGALKGRIKAFLGKDKNLPDGIVKGCRVITHWSEYGTFISMMNPDVANIILDFIETEPENPFAQRMKGAIEDAHERNQKEYESNFL